MGIKGMKWSKELPKTDYEKQVEALREMARRFRGEGVSDRIVFGDRPALARELAGAARETLRDWAWLAPRPRGWPEIPCAPVRRLVQRLSHWRGTREGGQP